MSNALKRLAAFGLCICYFSLFAAYAQDGTFFQNVEWSPDGSKICTQATKKSGNTFSPNSYIINISNGKTEQKIDGAGFPAWSADGKLVGYTKRNNSKKGADVWLFNVETGQNVMIHTDTSRSAGLTFSPDGKKICFSSDRDPKRNLYLMNIDGSNVERITFDTVAYFNPVWSSKGDQVIYYRERGDQRDKVYAIGVKNKKEVKLTDDTLHNYYPGWFPDGKTIYYTTSDPHGRDPKAKRVVFYDIKSKQKSEVAALADVFFAKVSRNGKQIAFIKGSFPTTNIYISDIGGQNVKCLTCDLKLE